MPVINISRYLYLLSTGKNIVQNSTSSSATNGFGIAFSLNKIMRTFEMSVNVRIIYMSDV